MPVQAPGLAELRLGIVGGGNMSSALIGGLLRSGASPSHIT